VPARAGTTKIRTTIRSRPLRAGITLLELLLALALTGVVMVIISMAMQLFLRTLDTRRADVEQAQIARAVLQHIAADIRNAVWYEPLDVSAIGSLAATGAGSSVEEAEADSQTSADEENTDPQSSRSQSSNQGASRNSEGALPDASTLPDGLEDLLDTEPSENVADIAATLAPASAPGLYGNQFELQIDCSRLPRVDQYAAASVGSDSEAAPSVPSDVKTVAYFLRTDDLMQDAAVSSFGSNANGLVRRELDRAAASFSARDGSLDPSQHPGQLLAPEITYLEFRYFDGSSWYTEWDSQQMGGLPTAIEITIGIDPAADRNREDLDVADVRELSVADTNLYMYRLTVHLPVAKPIVADDFSTMFDEEMVP
jgi:type II secretory pathway component PulJ